MNNRTAKDRVEPQSYRPHKNSACISFLRVYRAYFMQHLNKTLAGSRRNGQAVDEFIKKTADFYETHMYAENTISEKSTRSACRELIRLIPDTDRILNYTWLHMIDDYVTGLRRLKGRVDQVTDLITLLHELSRIMDESYFEISKHSAAGEPNVDTTTEEHKIIVSTFEKYLEAVPAQDSKRELMIHTFFRSIPVYLDSAVDRVDSASVTFSIHPYEAVALSKIKIALISSSIHDQVFRAYATSVDIASRKATLSFFTSEHRAAESRAYIRVELSRVTTAVITSSKEEFKGYIYDLSEVSSAVYIRNADAIKIRPGDTVRFVTELPQISDNKIVSIDIEATLLRSYRQVKGDHSAVRLVVQHDQDPTLKAQLARYVLARQSEIIRELKELS